MGKYLVLWETDEARIPVDPQEKKTGYLAVIDMVRQDIKSGILKDWGGFVGGGGGYAVAEGTEVEIGKTVTKYIPFFRFKVTPVTSLDQAEEVIKAIK